MSNFGPEIENFSIVFGIGTFELAIVQIFMKNGLFLLFCANIPKMSNFGSKFEILNIVSGIGPFKLGTMQIFIENGVFLIFAQIYP